MTDHKDPRMLMRYMHLRAADLARKLGSLLQTLHQHGELLGFFEDAYR